MVAALVSVAGSIGGSPAVTAIKNGPIEWASETFGDALCDFGDSGGFSSLDPAERQAFIAATHWPIVPSYSIAGAVRSDQVSLVNLPTWTLLARISPDNDGQVLLRDAIVPQATFLAAAKGDHWALGMPFDRVENDTIQREFINRNRFPRTALLEAAIRFVVDDLQRN